MMLNEDGLHPSNSLVSYLSHVQVPHKEVIKKASFAEKKRQYLALFICNKNIFFFFLPRKRLSTAAGGEPVMAGITCRLICCLFPFPSGGSRVLTCCRWSSLVYASTSFCVQAAGRLCRSWVVLPCVPWVLLCRTSWFYVVLEEDPSQRPGFCFG